MNLDNKERERYVIYYISYKSYVFLAREKQMASWMQVGQLKPY